MVRQYYQYICIAWLLFGFMQTTSAQVAIGTESLDQGAIFQLESDSKGLMIPRVTLSSRNDITTVNPSLVEGLLVYNTASAGSGNIQVSPGFYYWNGTEWIRIFNTGYTEQFQQTSAIRSQNDTTINTIPGLDRTFIAPYTGSYQIFVTGYYAAVGPQNSCCESRGTGSYMLEIDETVVASSFINSGSKKTPSNFLALGQQTKMAYVMDMVEGQSYHIEVRVKQWDHINMSSSSLDGIVNGNWGIWGVPTSLYNGNDLGIDDAQDAYMTITMLRQY